MSEQWRSIPGYEGLYEASDGGRIKALVRRNTKHRQYLRPTKRCDGYRSVGLFDNEGKQTNWLVHRAVLTAFHGVAPGMHGAHLNGRKDDNRLSNLKWATAAENASHRVIHGTDSRGEKNPAAELTADQVRAIRAEYAPRSTTNGCRALAAKYGTTMQNVWLIVTRRNWSHIE